MRRLIKVYIVRMVHWLNCPAGQDLGIRWGLHGEDERH